MKATQEQKINVKFAEKNNLSIDEMNAKAQEIYNELDANKFADDDARWARAYRRVRGAFRKKSKSMANAMDGMIVCRMTNNDFDRKQYDSAMRAVDRDGLDAAISKGLVNKDGQPIYRWGDKQGTVIVNQDNEPGRPLASGRAMGYTFKKNDNEEYDEISSRYIVISKKKVDDTIPVCQIGKLSISIGDDKQKGFFNDNNFAYYNDASISNEHKAPYTYDEVQEILDQWNRVFGDNMSVVSSVKELMEFQANHTFSKENRDVQYDFCVIPGIVSAVDNGGSIHYSDSVTLEFVDYDTLETSVITTYIPKEMLKGLDMADDDQGIFVLQSSSYVKNTGETVYQWHLGGFLHIDDSVDVEEFFGVSMEDEEEDVYE